MMQKLRLVSLTALVIALTLLLIAYATSTTCILKIVTVDEANHTLVGVPVWVDGIVYRTDINGTVMLRVNPGIHIVWAHPYPRNVRTVIHTKLGDYVYVMNVTFVKWLPLNVTYPGIIINVTSNMTLVAQYETVSMYIAKIPEIRLVPPKLRLWVIRQEWSSIVITPDEEEMIRDGTCHETSGWYCCVYDVTVRFLDQYGRPMYVPVYIRGVGYLGNRTEVTLSYNHCTRGSWPTLPTWVLYVPRQVMRSILLYTLPRPEIDVTISNPHNDINIIYRVRGVNPYVFWYMYKIVLPNRKLPSDDVQVPTYIAEIPMRLPCRNEMVLVDHNLKPLHYLVDHEHDIVIIAKRLTMYALSCLARRLDISMFYTPPTSFARRVGHEYWMNAYCIGCVYPIHSIWLYVMTNSTYTLVTVAKARNFTVRNDGHDFLLRVWWSTGQYCDWITKLCVHAYTLNGTSLSGDVCVVAPSYIMVGTNGTIYVFRMDKCWSSSGCVVEGVQPAIQFPQSYISASDINVTGVKYPLVVPIITLVDEHGMVLDEPVNVTAVTVYRTVNTSGTSHLALGTVPANQTMYILVTVVGLPIANTTVTTLDTSQFQTFKITVHALQVRDYRNITRVLNLPLNTSVSIFEKYGYGRTTILLHGHGIRCVVVYYGVKPTSVKVLANTSNIVWDWDRNFLRICTYLSSTVNITIVDMYKLRIVLEDMLGHVLNTTSRLVPVGPVRVTAPFNVSGFIFETWSDGYRNRTRIVNVTGNTVLAALYRVPTTILLTPVLDIHNKTHVTLRISGRLVDVYGDPIPDAVVTVHIVAKNGTLLKSTRLVTSRDGTFSYVTYIPKTLMDEIIVEAYYSGNNIYVGTMVQEAPTKTLALILGPLGTALIIIAIVLAIAITIITILKKKRKQV